MNQPIILIVEVEGKLQEIVKKRARQNKTLEANLA
jgi:hypothetical protein